MNESQNQFSRREFARTSLLTGSVVSLSTPGSVFAEGADKKRIKVGVIGCGSVARQYFPDLLKSSFVELISTCDIRLERARNCSEWYHVPHHYPHIDDMLAGEPFDFLVNLTDMQEHEHLNRKGLEAGKHVWSEKPIANSLEAGQELLRTATKKGLRLWGAPITVQCPQFAFMTEQLAAGKLGRVAAAHAHYGHGGPDWSSFFYEKGGGSMPDLAVYNLTTLTGLLGPARHVMAMTSIVRSERTIQDKGTINVTAEDNAMILMDHGNGVISHVQSGFNYFNPHRHDGRKETRYTLTLVGTDGFMGLVGYDWAPLGVDLATRQEPHVERHVTDSQGYLWQQGRNARG